VLTLELIRGVRIDEIGTLKSHGIDLKKTIQKGMDAFLHQVLVDGIFHCDLHAGNVLILENGDIGLVDFGSVGRLSQRVRDQLIHLFLALFSENYESLAYAYMELAPSNATQTDVEKFQKDLVDTLSPYFGMSIKDLDTGKVLMESSAVAVRHKLELPSDLILLFRALITAQGMAKALDPEFDIVQSSNRHIKTVIKVRYSKERLIGDAVLLARNSFDLIQMLPQQMRLFIRRLYLNQVGFQHNFPQLAKALHIHHGHYLHRTYIMAGCLFAFIGQMKLESTQPPVIFHLSLFVWLPWIVSIGFFILAVLQWIGIRLSGKP
jgi:ubiquinone biosynthesis protein